MLREYSLGFRVYVIVVGLAASLWLGLSCFGFDLAVWPHLLFFFLLLVVVEVVPMGLSLETGASFAPSIDMASILLFGPSPAALVCLAGRCAATLALTEGINSNPCPGDVSFYRIAHLMLAIQVSGRVYLRLGGTPMMEGHVPTVGAVGAMVLMYYLTYRFLSVSAYRIRYRTRTSPLMRAKDWRRILLTIALSLLFALAYYRMQVGLFGVLLFVLFLLLVMYASRLFVDMKSVYWGTVKALVDLIESNGHSRGHSDGVALYAVAIARKILLSEFEVTGLHWAAFLHDVGMVGIHERILKKEGPLTLEEWRIMSCHSEQNYQMLRRIPFLTDIAPAVRYHHERYDGMGYPLGLKGREIPLCARILAVADVYQALISPRPYRPAFSPEEARREVESLAGSALDPEVIEGFIQVWEDEMRWGKVVFDRHYRLDAGGILQRRTAEYHCQDAPQTD